jgi:hypothetical protein
MEGYYGAAAPHLLAYLDLVHDAAERSGVYLRCYMDDTSSYLSLDDLNNATRLFQKASQAVGADLVLSRRVRRERMPLDHVWLKRYHALKRAAKKKGSEFLGPDDPAAACQEFIRLAHKFDVGQYRESRPFAEYEETLSRRFRPPGPPPELCKGLSEEDWLDLQDNLFRLHRVGRWVRTVDDPNASDGKAVRMPGTHFQWAVQCSMSDDITDGNPWRCYIVARCEATAKTGPAMTMGIYDARARKGVAHRQVKIEESAGNAYRVFDLGAHNLHGGIYLWVAPRKNPDEVAAVYVDRIFLIREKRRRD